MKIGRIRSSTAPVGPQITSPSRAFPSVLATRNQTREARYEHQKYAAEAIGTFWLTFAGCGSAVIAAGFPQVGIGLVGVSLAFGLSVVTMAYAIGHISGCHLNPAVTVGLAAGGRFPTGQILPYVIAQVVGAIVAAALLYVIASGAPGFDVSQGLCVQRLWRAFARAIQHGGLLHHWKW